MSKIKFENNIIILGFGSIAKAVLPLISEHFEITPNNLTILAKDISSPDLAQKFQAKTIEKELTKSNYMSVLSEHVTGGDLIVNLTAGVSSEDLMRYASDNKILYLDTCIEVWPEEVNPNCKTHDDRQRILELQKEIAQNETTSLSSMGANPGIVSLLTKRVIFQASEILGTGNEKPKTKYEWARLAEKLTVRVIHINERDTQYTNDDVGPNDFVSTWSIEAMAIECIEPAEMALGTHEKELPYDSEYCESGNKRDIFFKKSGKDVTVSTWLPLTGEQKGMVLNHNEPLSLAQLYCLDNEENSYSPSVCFVYHPCEQAMESLKNLTKENYNKLNAKLALHDIVDGYDELGVFVMTEENGSFWLGSRLDIHTARKINPESSATSLQVAGGVIAGMCWVANNQKEGLIEPEDIQDYDYLLDIAERYWGGYVFSKSDWVPGGDKPDTTLQLKSFR